MKLACLSLKSAFLILAFIWVQTLALVRNMHLSQKIWEKGWWENIQDATVVIWYMILLTLTSCYLISVYIVIDYLLLEFHLVYASMCLCTHMYAFYYLNFFYFNNKTVCAYIKVWIIQIVLSAWLIYIIIYKKQHTGQNISLVKNWNI